VGSLSLSPTGWMTAAPFSNCNNQEMFLDTNNVPRGLKLSPLKTSVLSYWLHSVFCLFF
jgi:hypothetical protein